MILLEMNIEYRRDQNTILASVKIKLKLRQFSIVKESIYSFCSN